MAITFIAIATTELTSGAASITFSSIPATYTDLYLVISGRTNRSGAIQDNIQLIYNGSTSSQADRRIFSDMSSIASFTDALLYPGLTTANSATGSVFGSTMVYITNYATSNSKVSVSQGTAENNASGGAMNLGVESWANSAAITSIQISSRHSATLQPSTTATLYGIKNTV